MRVGVGDDGEDREDSLTRTVVPEDAVGSGGPVFDVSLKDFFFVWSNTGSVFVGVESRMFKVCLHQA